ncbi:magnesium-translocating P-type ATPase [Aestuariivirga sp.]|uniref:magnesium-translocating P-type ATPase n=1 Tax=Aestuariivirga sp. TaxID=2650926 RepID=UPI0039E70CF7
MRVATEATAGLPQDAYWARPADAVLTELGSSPAGLTAAEAAARLARDGANSLAAASANNPFRVFLRQFYSPLVLILVFAAVVSGLVGEGNEAIIIGAIVLASCTLSFTQEYSASKAMEALKSRIESKVTVLRGGAETAVPVDQVVAGDIVRLAGGNLIPADGVLLQARDFNVSEAALTGETFPVVKSPGTSPATAQLSERNNVVFTGTSVRSGTATMAVVRTGGHTEFASIAATLAHAAPETEFNRGIRSFGYLMTKVMLGIVIVIFFANILLQRPPIDSLLFSLALAVGLTPELLPAIISVTLARGARTMATGGVIVRRLDAVENLGSMDLLCTDKTGTLTLGAIRLDACNDAGGADSPAVRRLALLNATLQTGMANPLDDAITAAKTGADDIAAVRKVDEVPYDFVRKRLSVIVREKDATDDLLICKGAVANVLAVSTAMQGATGETPLDAAASAAIEQRVQDWSMQGFRVIAVAVRRFTPKPAYGQADEAGLTLMGFLLFFDPPKPGMAETVKALAARGIQLKMISGDSRYVAMHLAEAVGMSHRNLLTGGDIAKLSKEALSARVHRTDIFAEIDPNQKERIIAALRSRGRVVGYMGDGINDAPALHEADVGISVDGAVDVAREAADIILLKQDLGVLLQGVDDGRSIFANTMKYIAITTSANFGNMISMAFASLVLPFLPLLAQQILLNNFLSDVPSLAIATDHVDAEETLAPRHWDIGYIRRFMVTFGLVSSVFDFITFGVLIYVVNAAEAVFQTAWFVESLITELAIVLVVRTRRAAFRSRPGTLLAVLTLSVAVLAVAIPYLPGAGWFGFVPLPAPVMLALLAITLGYLVVSETTKSLFFAHEKKRVHRRRR